MRREAEASEQKRGLEDQLSGARQRQSILAELSRAHAQRRAALEKALAAAGIDSPAYLAGQAKARRGVGAQPRRLPRQPRRRRGARARRERPRPRPGPGRPLGRRARSSARPALPRRGRWWTIPRSSSRSARPSASPRSWPRALPPAFLVRTAADAERLARLHPGVAFLSREGVWVQAGTFHVEGEVATPGVLERESELAALAKQIPDLEGPAPRRRRPARPADRRARRARQGVQPAAGRGGAAPPGAGGRQGPPWRTRRPATAGSPPRPRRSPPSSRRSPARSSASAERRRQLQEELTAAEARSTGLQEDFDRAQAELEAAKAHREGLRTASAGRRGRLELLDERLESHDREMARLRGEVERGPQPGRRLARRTRTSSPAGAAELEAAIEQGRRTSCRHALEQRAAAEEGVLEEQERLDVHRQEIRAPRRAHRRPPRAARRRALRGRGAAHRPGQPAAGRRAPGAHLPRRSLETAEPPPRTPASRAPTSPSWKASSPAPRRPWSAWGRSTCWPSRSTTSRRSASSSSPPSAPTWPPRSTA